MEYFNVKEIGIGCDGLMKPTAYDTAWLARIPAEHDHNVSAFPEALNWIRHNQRCDGSWGAEAEFAHDRVISTLVAILALVERGEADRDQRAVEAGLRYIWEIADQLESEHETIGFEVILPALLEKCQVMGLALPTYVFKRYEKMRDEKMARIPPAMLCSKDTTMAFSLEFLGDSLDGMQIESLQEGNGSVGVSPSATAYFLTKLPNNGAARRYMAEVARSYAGQAPQVFPFDVFETAWSLWNLALAGFSPHDPVLASKVDGLARLWNQSEGKGVGFSSEYSITDVDDTAMAYHVLNWAGYEPEYQALRRFERDQHFVCYPWEREGDWSLSANIHVLHALRDVDHAIATKIVEFLKLQVCPEGYWADKWHISPYYTTAHAVIALVGLDDELAGDAVQWILRRQRSDGCWGYHGRPTVEETAYCLQALSVYSRCVESLDPEVLRRGREGLLACRGETPALWVGKCLYAPVRVVRSAIHSALVMTDTGRGA